MFHTALVIGLASLLTGSSACGDRTERTSSAPAGEGGAGQVLYLTYCQSCHGLEGRGDGPAALSLTAPPPDLTQLWTRYGTPLDRERLAQYIDGRSLRGVHRSREMPVWGRGFFEDALPLAPDMVEGSKGHLIDVLVGYLETLQTKRAL